MGSNEPEFAVPFICGATRSGTTLLRLMLDAHTDVAIPSETHFITKLIKLCLKQRVSADQLAEAVTSRNRWGDFHLDADEYRERVRALDRPNVADASRAFFQLYAEKQGKRRWGDKTPGYVKSMPRLQRVLPEARFVHLIRDGRDVALSLLPMNWGPSTVEQAAEIWRGRIQQARRQAPRLDHYIEVKYEDLITDTEPVLRRVCEFIELEFDPIMLDYHRTATARLSEKARDLERPSGDVQPAEARMASHKLASEPPRADRVARWKQKMSEADRVAYEAIAGDTLAELGYEVGTPVAA